LTETNENIVGGAKRVWPLLVWLPLIGLPLIAAVVAASLLSGCGAQSSQPSGQKPQRVADLGHPGLGDSGAPVVMVEYGDFQ
jgi:hypothetical protein